ncbi:MAG TPA: hypothetical protein VGT24_06790 [Candidatus Acidoferrales bacterium]|nr:hypothetical protein [Candidatus Acidoferrales bacterium]
MNARGLSSAIALALLIFASSLSAQTSGKETKVMIRAIARDAKVIGQHVGGAKITVRDAATGEILAQGVQQAGTGDTDLIMKKPHTRGMTIFNTADASGYLAVLHLDKPTVVEITAEGPLGSPQATQRASKTLLLVPGEDVLGEGILLEIHGFIITTLTPQPDAKVKAGSPFEVRATVTMTCGCPTEPGGLWDADKIHVVARMLRDGKVEQEIPMTYAGVQNTFHGDIPVTSAGAMELQVLAMDPANANFGMAREAVSIVP